MQSLLRWSIENSRDADGNPTPPVEARKDLDPAIIDHILGKPDAQVMKENLEVALDEKRPLDERLDALDNFEMLIEHIDNASDLEKLKMWEPLHCLLTSESSHDEIQRLVLWIIGTAVQNNPSAQSSYLKLSPIRALLQFISPTITSAAKTRSKAVYALSGLLKHNTAAVHQLQEADGWEALKSALEDSDITVRRKAAFLINSLLMPTVHTHPHHPAPQPEASAIRAETPSSSTPTAPSTTAPSQSTAMTLHPTATSPTTQTTPTYTTPNVRGPETATNVVHPNSHASMLSDPSFFSTSEMAKTALEEKNILKSLVDGLTNPVPHGPDGELEGDLDFEQKVISILHTYLVSLKGQLPADLHEKLVKFVKERREEAGSDAQLAEKSGMATEDVVNLRKALRVE